MDIDFTFDSGDIATLHITGHRAGIIAHEPDGPVSETLSFGTAVVPAMGGREQRSSFRKRPRQGFEVEYTFDVDKQERRRWSAQMLTSQSKTLALPLIHEGVRTTAAASIGAATISVVTTASIDFRIGGHLIIFSDPVIFDVAKIVSMTATTVTVENVLTKAYAAGAVVAPLRFVRIVGQVTGARRVVGVESVRVRYEAIENDVGAPVGDVSAFPTLDGRVVFDRRNVMADSRAEAWNQDILTIDNASGVVSAVTDWDRTKHGSDVGFLTQNRAQLWELRQLLYALRGRFTSFWLPTRAVDLVLTDGLASSDDSMSVENDGYTRFVNARQPMATFRITFTDGTSLVRTIISSEVCSDDTEILSLDQAWPLTYSTSQVARIEWLELVRFASDEFRIEHHDIGRARMTASTLVVQDVLEPLASEDWGIVAEVAADQDEWGSVDDSDVDVEDWGGI